MVASPQPTFSSGHNKLDGGSKPGLVSQKLDEIIGKHRVGDEEYYSKVVTTYSRLVARRINFPDRGLEYVERALKELQDKNVACRNARAELYLLRARLLGSLGKYGEALTACENAVKHVTEPESAAGALLRARALHSEAVLRWRRGDPKDAVRAVLAAGEEAAGVLGPEHPAQVLFMRARDAATGPADTTVLDYSSTTAPKLFSSTSETNFNRTRTAP